MGQFNSRYKFQNIYLIILTTGFCISFFLFSFPAISGTIQLPQTGQSIHYAPAGALIPYNEAVSMEIGGGTSSAGGIPVELLLSSDIWIFLFSIALFTIAFFLLYQGVAFQRWVTSNEESAPNPKAGVTMSWLSSFGIIFIWALYLYRLMLFRGQPLDAERFVIGVIIEPRDFAPPLLVASVVPATVALYKFLITISFMRAIWHTNAGLSRLPVAALTGAIFTGLQICASVLTLIMFFTS